jgi:hypothetical protein
MIKYYLYTLYKYYLFSFSRVKKYHVTILEKKFWEIVIDLINWHFSELKFNDMYYAMGLNSSGTKNSEFFGRRYFSITKEMVENVLKKAAGADTLNYDIITRDKFYANSILAAHDFPVVIDIGLIVRSKIYVKDASILSINDLIKWKSSFVLKNVNIESGEGVLVCTVDDNGIYVNGKHTNTVNLIAQLGAKVWLIQERIESHITLKRFNTVALNTTRIVTIFNGEDYEYLAGFQSFATGAATIDSWSKGSVYVGIDPANECLKSFGITSPSDVKAGIQYAHPDSNLLFDNYHIPFLKDAIKLCCHAHSIFYFNFIIGWDVAITDEGPMIIEANEMPGMNVVQCLDGPLKHKIEECKTRILAKFNHV